MRAKEEVRRKKEEGEDEGARRNGREQNASGEGKRDAGGCGMREK